MARHEADFELFSSPGAPAGLRNFGLFEDAKHCRPEANPDGVSQVAGKASSPSPKKRI